MRMNKNTVKTHIKNLLARLSDRNKQPDADDAIAARIRAAEKYRRRDEKTQATEAASPVSQMTGWRYPVGWILRFLVMLCGVYGMALFWNDAVRIVVLSGKRTVSAFTLPAGFFLTWSIVACAVISIAALTKWTRLAVPVVSAGAGLLYLFAATGEHPLLVITNALLSLWNCVLINLAEIGYTTYVRYMYTGVLLSAMDPNTLLTIGAAFVTLLYGILLCLTIVRRSHPVPLAFLLAVVMIPVFLFNITVTNTGVMLVLVFICAAITLCVYDLRFDGRREARMAKKAAAHIRKMERKAAKQEKKDAALALQQSAENAWRTVMANTGDKKAAYAARKRILAAAKQKQAAEKQHKLEEAKRLKREKKENRIAEKKRVSAEKAARKAAEHAGRNAMKVGSSAANRAQKAAERAAARQKRQSIRQEKSAARRERYTAARMRRETENKRAAVGGFAGGMALLIAFCAIWLPYSTVQKNFPIVDLINNRMQIARMYVTAYLMGDDVDLNSLSLYGGVADLNPRTVDFDTPQYTGKRIFTLDAGYAAPVYMRSWIGTNYDTATDTWLSATPDEVVAYRERFGSAYTPDHITYFFNKFVYPKSVDITRFDQYRNLDDYGFRVFQVNVKRDSGTSKLLFVPAFMNSGLGLMRYGSIDPVEKKYSAYYDGIYSSRFFGEDSSYSTSSFVTTMKSAALAENYEKSILYYNTALSYMEMIDLLEESAEQGVYTLTEDNFVKLTSGGVKLETDAFGRVIDSATEETRYSIDNEAIAAQFEADMTAIGYKWDGESLVRRYFAMDAGERAQIKRSCETEQLYREYVNETYTTPFDSAAVREIADTLLAENGITNLDLEESTRALRPNTWESPFVNPAGEVVPRHTVVLSVIDYLRENYTYTLEPEVPTEEVLDAAGNPVLDENGEPITQSAIVSENNLDAFLTEVKEGYCVHFATAAVGILREMGFAVRYDEGYIASRWNRTYAADAVARYRTSVRDYDAHAWIEVYYPCIGWVQYETTPSFCEAIYDADAEEGEVVSSGSSYYKPAGENSQIDTTETDDETDTVDQKDRAILTVCLVLVVCAILYGIVAVILRIRAGKRAQKRAELVRQSADRTAFLTGQTDVHAVARKLTDHIFAVYRALGCPHEPGELPVDYARRLQDTFGELSAVAVSDVVEIIEKEEFGGTLTPAEFASLGQYAEEMDKAVYAGANLLEKIRLRYILALV